MRVIRRVRNFKLLGVLKYVTQVWWNVVHFSASKQRQREKIGGGKCSHRSLSAASGCKCSMKLVGRMSGEGEGVSDSSSITEIRGESTTSWPELFLSCLKSLTTFEKVGLRVGLVLQQARNISCKPWVLNRELLGSGGRLLHSAGNVRI